MLKDIRIPSIKKKIAATAKEVGGTTTRDFTDGTKAVYLGGVPPPKKG